MKNFQHLAFINRKHQVIYDRKSICKELDATASGTAYYENALYIARDLPELDENDRDILGDWLECADKTKIGSHDIQDVILKIRNVILEQS